MPPESLFLHSLRCPSPLVEDPTLIGSLLYPKTVKLQNPFKNLFTQSFQESSTELCFSSYAFCDELNSNFFYKDCPGVVNSNHLDNSKKTFTLPGVLWVECANSVGSSEGDINGFDKNAFRILPSDLWAIQREVGGWVDYPRTYSYGVFSAILQLNVITTRDLRRWVISNSPRYGVVIDVYMRDHLSVLFSLCLKAIRREALGLMGLGMNMKTLSFNCPLLGQVLMWIASQLSVLYGEVNATCFAIHIFRQCVLEVAKGVLFPWESNLREGLTELDSNGNDVRDLKLKEPLEGTIEFKVGTEGDESVGEKVIFASQVAASVAALHERSLLEAKFKRLRVSQPLTRCQRMAEHDYISKRADEERKKRPNYRAIIEHDGLPSKQSSNQKETSKTKTRAELLAEERDYKRRRMSYRGKKLKRTTLQVMRDIIDEYMEEIKEAGGIGCFEKGAEEERVSPKPPFTSDITMDVDELRKSNSKFSESIRAATNHYQKQSHLDHNIRSTTSKDASPRDYEQGGHDRHRHRKHIEYQRNTSRDRHSGDYYSGSPERHRSHGLLHEQSSRQREQDDLEFTIMKHENYKSSSKTGYQRSSSKTSYQNYKSSHSISDPANVSSVQKDGEKLDVRDRHLRNAYGNRSSKFLVKKEFEDRYDPSESHDK